MLGLFCLLMTDFATAGDYELVVGKGTPLCEACLKNLEQMTTHPVCDHVYRPQLGLGSPAWEKLDVYKHKNLYKRASKYLGFGDEFANNHILDDDEQLQKYLSHEIPGGLAMHRAQVDLDNDGTPEQVLKLTSHECRSTRLMYGTDLVVFSPNLDGVKKAVSDQIKQTYVESTDQAGANQTYGVFTYRGKTYFDLWNAYYRDVARRHHDGLTIYAIESGTMKTLCELQAARRR